VTLIRDNSNVGLLFYCRLAVIKDARAIQQQITDNVDPICVFVDLFLQRWDETYALGPIIVVFYERTLSRQVNNQFIERSNVYKIVQRAVCVLIG